MAVVKLTASKKAVQFIDDEGNVFQTSVLWISSLLSGNNSNGLILLTRLPEKVSKDRFKVSPVLGNPVPEQGEVDLSSDPLSRKSRKEKVLEKQYKDVKVW